MIVKKFSLLDYAVFVGLLIASSFIGIFFAYRSRASASHFLTGNRKLTIFPVTLSLVASFMSTNTLLGVPAEVFQVGTQYVLQSCSITLIIFIAANVFLPVYYDLKIVSVNEVCRAIYSVSIIIFPSCSIFESDSIRNMLKWLVLLDF